jgi:hypothetical protein
VSIVSSIVVEVLKLHGVAAYAVIRRLGFSETALLAGWQPRPPSGSSGATPEHVTEPLSRPITRVVTSS